MKVAGIVAEYNPFHKGHQYQTELLREMGFDGIVAVMSGNFVQRADAAITDKYRRAEGAVRSGVDLVIELPLPYAVASAEDFASGGIGVLAATGIVDAVCCGCESGAERNLDQYQALCRAEEEGRIGERMRQGYSYPSACREAVRESGGFWSEEPNDVLALAYRKALARIAPEIPLIAIQRKGRYHGTGDGFVNAETVRGMIAKGENVRGHLPEGSSQTLENAPIADLSRMERAILAYLRTHTPEELHGYYGMREGIAERICKENGAKTLSELYERVKTKRFPHSAVRRAVLCAYLGLPFRLPELSYVRILAFNDRGQELLRRMKKTATLPVVPILTPQMRTDPVTAAMTELQLSGDEIFAFTTEIPASPLRDLTESARKISQFGKKI